MDAVFATRRVGTDAVFARLFYEATGTSVQITATTDDAAFSGGAVVAGSPDSVLVGIGATTSDAIFSGSTYVSPSFRISVTTDSAVFSGLILFGGTPVYTRAPTGSGYKRRAETQTRPPQTNTVRH